MIFLCFLLHLTGCTSRETPKIGEGVDKSMAKYRKNNISDIHYSLRFQIPASKKKPVTAKMTLKFDLNSVSKPVAIDFRGDSTMIQSVIKKVRRQPVRYQFHKGHIIIPQKYLQLMDNFFEIDFIAGNSALNRQENFLYSLFVPDRASTAFPCFDQPDLKAVYDLTIEIPANWQAVSNGAIKNTRRKAETKIITFHQTKPISTYQFAFTAGRFARMTSKDSLLTMYFIESDSLKAKKQADTIFSWIQTSIEWLERYTNIHYPWQHYDFIAIPSFQFRGMEHPGAVYYRASGLFLPQQATQAQHLSRAGLIAHETAHMWFGNLVTMKWFNEVWLKEVFANFYADKIIKPYFKDISFRHLFYCNHYPAAKAIDRTAGTIPVMQNLDNLLDAGTMYGPIIYHKAPVIMNMLEKKTGKEHLKAGIREYLQTYLFSNADWDDLIAILHSKTTVNLKKWSDDWIYTAGMPVIRNFVEKNTKKTAKLIITQSFPAGKKSGWTQQCQYLCQYEDTSIILDIDLKEDTVRYSISDENLQFILPNSDASGYGYFSMDSQSLAYFHNHPPVMNNDMAEAVCLSLLYEEMIHGRLGPQTFIQNQTSYLRQEKNQENIRLSLQYIERAFHVFLPENQKKHLASELESLCMKNIRTFHNKQVRTLYFRYLMKLFITDKTWQELYDFWTGKTGLGGLKLSEIDLVTLSYQLAVRNREMSETILKKQIIETNNPELKAKMIFMRPVFSPESSVRDSFFLSLQKPENRAKESWVTESVGFFYHPANIRETVRYIKPSLQLLPEIQRTGDIFFPSGWAEATLQNHRTREAATTVRGFLSHNQDFPKHLRKLILQHADLLFRLHPETKL